MKDYDVIVIGAGAAGLLAAGRAAEKQQKVLLLEKMKQEGRKLRITGKGRCNITNDAPIDEFIQHVYPRGRFLKHAFHHFFSNDILQILQEQGLECNLERGGRYFPASNEAADVLTALKKWIEQRNVQLLRQQKVDRLLIENNCIVGVQANGKEYKASKVILATGGKSYPATGSTGDGLEFAAQAGHKIVPTRPALVPLETKEPIHQKLKGIKLKNVQAVVWVNGKKQTEEFGELEFMDFGLSGPIVLTLSRLVVDALRAGHKVDIYIDLKPALNDKKLDNRLLREFDEHGKKQLINVLPHLLPSGMIPFFLTLTGISPEKECHQVSAKERKRIRYNLKNMPFAISGYRTFKEAIITAGGVSTKEISPKTMESKLVKGLYFAGEIIDLDADTGGYNLQIAWSTGWLAGDACGNSEEVE